ncbi:MAG: putative toxin-antitoxin system toxin component, PIN family [Chloroflexota bacterium]
MTYDLRFVFDTNTIVSALLMKQSVPRKSLDEAQHHGKLLISLETLNELNDVLRREKFNKYVTESERLRFLSLLVRDAIRVEITDPISECCDPKDDKFLELAISGRADYIVSGDNDLLVLNPFRGVSIVRPSDLLERLGFVQE